MNDEFTLADALSEIEMFTQVLLETASVRCSALDVGLDALMQYAPIDPEPVRIARELQSIQRPKFYGVEASVTHRGYYQHENCTEINVFDRGSWADGETEEAVKDCLRDFMRWIYSQLESEYEYLTSDECVRDSIEANEYTFTKDGAVCSASADCRRHRTDEAYRLTRYRPACTAGYIMTIKRDRSMETTRSLAEYPEPHVQHIMELVRRELSHYGFTRTPTDTEIRAMIRSGMTMCGIYGACCDVMAGFDLYESIEANREATQ